MLDLLDALARQANHPPLISCRHEAGAAFMADGSARFGDEPGLCIVGRAPGALNTCLALHTAHTDSVPLVLIIGQASSADAGREAYLDSADFQQTFGPMSKWVGLVNRAERIPELFAQAFQIALSCRRGPVVLIVPEDVLASPLPTPDLPPQPAPRATGLDEATLQEIQSALLDARQPILLAGGSGWTRAACEQLRAFAEAYDLPVATAYRRRDLLDNRHPCFVGELGIGVDRHLAACIEQSDLVLALGLRLGELNTITAGVFKGFALLTPPVPRQKLIHVHADARELNRVYQATLAVNATPTEVALDLARLPGPASGLRWSDWRKTARANREAYVAGGSCPGGLDLKEIFLFLRETLDDDTIVTCGAGAYALWPQRYFECRHFGTLAGPKSGAMGYGLPAAIGLKLAYPERQVVAFAGDGCFLMTAEELATAVHYDIDVLILVVNNHRYGAIGMNQQRQFDRTEGVDLSSPNFADYARSFGAFGASVETTEAFPVVLRRALAHRGPALIELKPDPQAIKPADG